MMLSGPTKLKLEIAATWYARAKGLLGKRTMDPDQALWLKPCACIHTFGMHFSICVFFIDENERIIKTVSQLRPNRIAVCLRATSAIEMIATSDNDLEVRQRCVQQALVLQSQEKPRRNLGRNYSTKQPRR